MYAQVRLTRLLVVSRIFVLFFQAMQFSTLVRYGRARKLRMQNSSLFKAWAVVGSVILNGVL